MKKIKAFLTVLALTVSALGFAQNITVTGSVIDASTKEGVPFAAIQIKGTSKGATADVDGNYSISVSKTATLVFSSIGYETTEVAVAGKTQINVTLKSDNVLQETVVVGYGSAKKVSSVVGAVTTVKADVVKNAPAASALDQLQGQVAGLSVLTSSGVAGDDAVSMTLHGTGSLGSSSEPLFVVDGVPSSSRSVMAMNPNDIVSVSVLKDATATSIYGSRAANGVVYITTKSGSYDTKASVTIRSQYGVNTLANPQFYKNMMSGDEWIDFRLRSGTMSYASLYNNYISKGYTNNTEWYKIFQNVVTPQYQNDVTVEGGGKKVAYMLSASQFHQKGQTIGNYYDRYTVRTNVQAHPTNWLKVGANVNMSIDQKQTNPNWGSAESGMSNYTSGGLSYLLNPLYPAYDEDGNLYEQKFPMGSYNPYYYMENHPDLYTRYGLNGNFNIEIEPFRNFKIISRAGTDAYITLDNWKTYPSYLGASGSGTRGKSTAFSHNDTITNTIEYSWSIAGDHHFSALLGQEGINNYYDYYYAQSTKQSDDRLMNLQNGAQSTYGMSESLSQSRFLSFFAHVDYDYAEKYFFDVTVRNDSCSRFGLDKRNAWFWSLGGMWKIKKENFMQGADWVNTLDMKVSYGTQGNAAIGNYSHLGLVSTSNKYQDAVSNVLGQPSNRDLTWEQQALLTVGVAGRLFDRLNFDIAYYNRKTTSMLMSVPFPYTTGFSSMTANVGGLLNQGVDITLGVDILRGRNYYLTFNTTFNYNNEKVVELFDAAWDEDLQRYRWEIANTGIAYVVGQPVGFYCPIYAGVDPTDGAPTWYLPGDDRDVCTMDPTRTTKNYDEDALTQNTGLKRHAPINGGFGLRGGYKGFSFVADFSYVLGKTLICNDGYFYANPANFTTMNQHKAVSDFWTPENTDATYPDWSKGYVMQFDTHLYQDASFLRLKNLQIAYDFGTLFKNNDFLRNLKLTLTGRNLLTFTKYEGMDPEVDSNLTYGIAGNSRQFLGGVEITFGGNDSRSSNANAASAKAEAKAAASRVK